MTVISTCITPRDRYVLDDVGPLLTQHKLRYDGHRHVMGAPPSASIMIQVTCSDDYLFVLMQNGEVWRQHINSENYHRLSVPLGVTFITTTPNDLQMIHGGGSIISSIKLPGDVSFEQTNTGALTNIKSVAGDEKQRIILLDDGSVFVQDYHRGGIETVPVPLGVEEVELGREFFYFRTATGDIFRVRDYRLTGYDQLGGITGALSFAVSSDHRDAIWVHYPTGPVRITPDTWTAAAPPPPDGWVVADWVDADWVEVA